MDIVRDRGTKDHGCRRLEERQTPSDIQNAAHLQDNRSWKGRSSEQAESGTRSGSVAGSLGFRVEKHERGSGASRRYENRAAEHRWGLVQCWRWKLAESVVLLRNIWSGVWLQGRE